MSNAETIVTVLLAAPSDARDVLRAALEATQSTLVEVDPLSSNADSVLKHSPNNVVVLLDGTTEDALDSFESVLADPAIRLLFEEASVVTARQGWDSARWSRHLSAKLKGSENVLPEGVGDDQGFVAPKPRDAIKRPVGALQENGGEDAEPDAAADTELQPALNAVEQTPQEDTFEFDDHALEDAERAFQAQPEVQAPVETKANDEDASWQMFQAYDVEHDWSPPAETQEIVDAPSVNFTTSVSAAAIGPEEHGNSDPLAEDLPMASENLRATDVTHALDSAAAHNSWELHSGDDVPTVAAPVAASAESFVPKSDRFSTLSLMDDGTDGLEAPVNDGIAVDFAGTTQDSTRLGAVFIMSGAGGPDPLRTVLGALPANFPRTIFIQQFLDAGNYDRLARQMERASNVRVALAVAADPVVPGQAYVVPPGMTVERSSDVNLFVLDPTKRGFVDFTEHFPATDSAMVVLSGADVAWAETASKYKASGAWLTAQAETGCFDYSVPAIMVARGAESLDPELIAQKLNSRWNMEEQQ